MSRHDPITPHVLYIADQHHPWHLAAYERLATRYHTPTTVNLAFGTSDSTVKRAVGKSGVIKQQTGVWCLPDDAAWDRAVASRAALQAALDAFADGLRLLGSYASQFEAAGGIKKAPNPLSPTVILTPDPDDADESYFIADPIPRLDRRAIVRHTPKMLSSDPKDGYVFSQHGCFVCPDDAAWKHIQALRGAVVEQADAWTKLLRELGTYGAALADGRYGQHAKPPAAPDTHRSVPAEQTPRATAADFAYGSLVVWKRADSTEVLGRVTTCFSGKKLALCVPPDNAVPRYVDPARCRPATKEESSMPRHAPTAAPLPRPRDDLHRLPPLLSGWRHEEFRETHEVRLVAPDGWTTKKYQSFSKAISEALRRVNSQPKAASHPALGPGQPEPAPWPDPPDGWRWNRRGAPAHLIAPDGGWKTANYNDPQRALTEAQGHIELDSARWRLIAAGYDVQPQGMHWVVRINGSDATMLKSAELIDLASDLPARAPAALITTGPSAIVGVVMMDEAEVIALAQSYPAAVEARIQANVQVIAAMVADTPGALSTALQECARRYVAAREQAGAALLEMAAALHDARQQAQHGEWYTFLESIGTGEDAADRLLNIHEMARGDPAHADAIRRNFLNPTTAALLARPSTPPAVVEQALSRPEPPTSRQIETQIRGVRGEPKSRSAAGFDPADDEHVKAVHTILNTLDQWPGSARPERFKEAYAHAREVRELTARDALFAAIDRAVDGTKEPAPTPKPSTALPDAPADLIVAIRAGNHAYHGPHMVLGKLLHTIAHNDHPGNMRSLSESELRSLFQTPGQTIAIRVNDQDYAIVPTRRVKDLALHTSVKNPPDPGCAWAITYVPKGGLVGSGFPDERTANAALDELARLDWSGVQGDTMPPTLATKAREILARYNGMQETAPSQAGGAPSEPPPATPLAAATTWLSEMRVVLARCPESTMFRLSEMQEAVAHVEALLAALAESGAAPERTDQDAAREAEALRCAGRRCWNTTEREEETIGT